MPLSYPAKLSHYIVGPEAAQDGLPSVRELPPSLRTRCVHRMEKDLTNSHAWMQCDGRFPYIR